VQACHSAEPNARRPFATAPYRPSARERLEPWVVPRTCVYAAAEDEPCRIGVRQHRDRKTGPAYPLVVLRCHTHGRAFTLYPLGHFPYGRTAAAPVSADGEVLWSGEAGAVTLRWEPTLFAPAFAPAPDAASATVDRRGWHFTEPAERLGVAAAVLGLDVPLPDRVGEALAARLDLPRLTLRQAAAEYRVASGRAARAGVIRAVLARLRPDGCLLDRLLGAGALAACWGTVVRWDEGPAGARCRVFPGRGTPAG
jgi:hypothetical protein